MLPRAVGSLPCSWPFSSDTRELFELNRCCDPFKPSFSVLPDLLLAEVRSPRENPFKTDHRNKLKNREMNSGLFTAKHSLLLDINYS